MNALEPSAQRLSQDAAIVLALAETSVWFAASPEEESGRWLRVMRLHGRAGCVLQAVGVPESPLGVVSPTVPGRSAGASGRLACALVRARASERCGSRGDAVVSTADLLHGVAEAYGPAFERTLEAHGNTLGEVLGRLDREPTYERASLEAGVARASSTDRRAAARY